MAKEEFQLQQEILSETGVRVTLHRNRAARQQLQKQVTRWDTKTRRELQNICEEQKHLRLIQAGLHAQLTGVLH